MLLDELIKTAKRAPHRVAVSDSSRSLTYSQMVRLARVFRSICLRESKQNRVGIMLPASATFPAAFFGALWADRIVVPLNFLLHADELNVVVEDAKLDLILTTRHFEKLADSLSVRALYLEDLPLRRGLAATYLRSAPMAPTVETTDTAIILYTSGTTAAPKGVELTFGNLYSNCIDTIASLKIQPGQQFLNMLPPFHVFGLTANVLIPIVLDSTVFAMPRFSPLAAVRTVAQHRITVVLAIPSMFGAILRTKSAKREHFDQIYMAITGGEPLSDSIRRGFKERFGVTLRQGYGLTETSPVVAACSIENDRDGTVGQPIRNVEVRIVNEDGTEQATPNEGEILVRGPGVMKGYFGKPEETKAVLDDAGWFSTGDIGRVDADGYLSITGRAKEMLIIGGENVFPREIEAVLENHDQVLQAAVIGLPDELRGEVPAAFVIPQPGTNPTEANLRSHAKAQLAGFKVPKKVIISEDLPTGPTGKIIKRQLHDRL